MAEPEQFRDSSGEVLACNVLRAKLLPEISSLLVIRKGKTLSIVEDEAPGAKLLDVIARLARLAHVRQRVLFQQRAVTIGRVFVCTHGEARLRSAFHLLDKRAIKKLLQCGMRILDDGGIDAVAAYGEETDVATRQIDFPDGLAFGRGARRTR